MSECAQSRKITKRWRRQGAMTYPLRAGRDAPIGWPDSLVVVSTALMALHSGEDPSRGFNFFAEFKTKRNKLSDAQRQVCSDLTERGMCVAVIRLAENDNAIESIYGESISVGITDANLLKEVALQQNVLRTQLSR